MRTGGQISWRIAARMFFVPIFVWMLVAQSLLLPLARARAAVVTGSDAALAILCSSTLPNPAGDDGGESGRGIHDLGCCLLCGRFVVDAPMLALTRLPAVLEPVRQPVRIAFERPQSRAPPAITATPSRSRAPPSFT